MKFEVEHELVERFAISNRPIDASLVVACRDDESFIESFLNSVNRMTDVNLEVVLVDDGSHCRVKPSDLEALRWNWTLVRTERLGLSSALNLAAMLSNSGILARHDLDDVSTPSRIAKQISYMRKNDLDVVGSQAWVTDSNLVRLIQTKLPCDHATIAKWLNSPYRGNPIVHGSALIRRKSFEVVGGYVREFAKSQDLDLWIRLLATGAQFGNLEKPEYYWRARSGSAGSSSGLTQSTFARLARMSQSDRPSLREIGLASTTKVKVRTDAFVAAAAGSRRGSIGVLLCWWKVRTRLTFSEHLQVLLLIVWSSSLLRFVRPLLRRIIRIRG